MWSEYAVGICVGASVWLRGCFALQDLLLMEGRTWFGTESSSSCPNQSSVLDLCLFRCRYCDA